MASSSSSPSVQLHKVGVVDSFDPSASSSALPRTPSPSGTSSRPCSLRADINISFDASSNEAFFKIEASISLLNPEALQSLTHAQRTHLTFTTHAGSRPPTQLKVALHIHPEQIISIAAPRLHKLPDHLIPLYQQLADRDSVALQMTLSYPPTLIIPNLPGRLIPQTQSDLDILTAFQRIAGATTSAPVLTLYVPGTALTDAQASTICASVISSTTVNERPTFFRTLFKGLGARAVPLDEVAGIVDQTSPTTSPSTRASPPAYNESGHEPPVYNIKDKDNDEDKDKEDETGRGAARKRQRQSSSSPVPTNSRGEKEKGPADQQDQAAQAHILQQLLGDAVSVIPRLQALVAQADAKEVLLCARLAEADAKIGALEDGTAGDEHEASEGLDAYIDNRMDDLREELVSRLDERFEDLGADVLIRSEMEEFVEEQVQAAITDLRDRLAGGGVRVLLPDED